jgi:glycosyltransferase involved in cell wall biosynthesis
MKVLLLVPHVLSAGRRKAVEEGRRPKPDYDALAEAIQSLPGGEADILDRSTVDREPHPLVRFVRRVAGYNWALALLGFLGCQHYDVVFTHAENIGAPLALMLKSLTRRPRHVTTANYMTGWRNRLWYRLLAVDRQMDAIFTLSEENYQTALTKLRIPKHKLRLLDAYGFVDIDFYRACPKQMVNEHQVCAVGREFRDYGTLFRAVAALPEVRLKVESNSPWSIHPSTVEHLEIPANVEICRLEFGTVRTLYAESAIVAIPLRPNPIGAGFTVLLEAMAMGKPVIITNSPDSSYAGRRQIIHGENVLMVRAGDVEGWQLALKRLIDDPALRARLGENARLWVQNNASRKTWLAVMLGAFQPEVHGSELTLASPRP